MSKPRGPGVSIGIPVFNGERYLADALGSILDQTYRDLEVIVTDNASTDATADITRRIAASDARVRYVRNLHNLGAPRNFNLAFRLSTRRYFKWASHDDLLDPDFIGACVAALEADQRFVVAFSSATIIDEHGAAVRPLRDELRRLADPDRVDRRLRDITTPSYGCFHVWGVMRADAIDRTRLHGAYPGSDRVFLAEMALQGPFAAIERRLFLLRDHGGRSVKSLPTIYTRASWHDPTRRGRAILPHWRIGLEYVRSVLRARLGGAERVRALATLATWSVRDWSWVKLLLDVAAPIVPGVPRLYVAGRRWARARRRSRRLHVTR